MLALLLLAGLMVLYNHEIKYIVLIYLKNMREKEPSTKIIFIRHGITDFPKDRLYCDDIEDPSLNKQGLHQAQMAADLLQDFPVDAIVASPMKRTFMTAEAISDKTKVQIQTNPALKERPFGIWDGLYFDAIERDFPDDYYAWKKNPATFIPEGGESIIDLLTRVKNALDEIISKYSGQTVVVVSHVGPIRVLISHSIGMPIENYRQLTIDYGSLTRIDYGKRQNNLIYLNRYRF